MSEETKNETNEKENKNKVMNLMIAMAKDERTKRVTSRDVPRVLYSTGQYKALDGTSSWFANSKLIR